MLASNAEFLSVAVSLVRPVSCLAREFKQEFPGGNASFSDDFDLCQFY
jgi:hypothetical protein